jgi:hypothetical protein
VGVCWPGLMGPLHKVRRSRVGVCVCVFVRVRWSARVRGRVRVSLCGTSGPHARTWNARLSAVRSGYRVQEQPGST